jgi:hypothetical protein
MKKWAIAVIFGVLMPYPINLLAQYLAQQSGSGNVWYGYALSALMFLSYFFLGVFLGKLASLRTAGTVRRVRWGELALGVVLFLVSLAMKLEQATGLVTANIEFIRNNAVMTPILQSILLFNDGLYLWVVLAGFFLADAFERVPAQSEARVETPRVKKVKTKKAKAKASEAQPSATESSQAAPAEAKPAEIQPVVNQSAQTAPIEARPVEIQPIVNQPAQAAPVVQTQSSVVAPAQAAPVEANPGT